MSSNYEDWIELEERNETVCLYSGYDYLGCEMDDPEETIDDIWDEFLDKALKEVDDQCGQK